MHVHISKTVQPVTRWEIRESQIGIANITNFREACAVDWTRRGNVLPIPCTTAQSRICSFPRYNIVLQDYMTSETHGRTLLRLPKGAGISNAREIM